MSEFLLAPSTVVFLALACPFWVMMAAEGAQGHDRPITRLIESAKSKDLEVRVKAILELAKKGAEAKPAVDVTGIVIFFSIARAVFGAIIG